MSRRIFLAFLRRDAADYVSYKSELILDSVFIVFSVATSFFVARLFKSAGSQLFSEFGGDYFAFVLIGIAYSEYQWVGLYSFSRSIRQEQFLGTIESVFTSPIRLSTFLLASAQSDFLLATVHVTVYFLVGFLLFGLRLPFANWAGALLVLLTALAAFMGLGILSAACILKFKRGDPIAQLVASLSSLLGGVFFPVAILPAGLRGLSALLPITYALTGLRKTLLQGASISQVGPSILTLLGFSVLLVSLGLFVFRQAFDSARRDGSLGHY